MKLLNLGCGIRFHKEWTNLDFISYHPDILSHNLLNGIPYPDHTFDVVYHSHLLEHFRKQEGLEFIKECYRVLKPGGIIRVAVPDLEGIVRCYLEQLAEAKKGNLHAQMNYEWIMLEMYDQVLRNQSGGEMKEFLYDEKLENESFVFSRLGEEGKVIRDYYLKSINKDKDQGAFLNQGLIRKFKTFIKKSLKSLTNRDYLLFFLSEKEKKWMEIGKFRMGGEIHQWMYDEYSLSKLLKGCGFKNLETKSAFESTIPDWNKYELDSKQGIINKPDSLYLEARK